MPRSIPKCIVVFAIFTAAACCCLPALFAQVQEPPVFEGSKFNTNGERIGDLRLWMTGKEAGEKIPCKPQKSKEIFEDASGEYYQSWKFPQCGIVLGMVSERKGGMKVIRSIIITSPGKLVTSGGIHIGSTENEVIESYGRYLDPEDGFTKKGEEFVAGSVYDGMIFYFKNDKVVRIFLGTAAE